jgi:hypothetical protein
MGWNVINYIFGAICIIGPICLIFWYGAAAKERIKEMKAKTGE